MKTTGIAAAFLALLMLMVPFAGAEAPVSGLCYIENGTAVFSDASMETLFGALAPGQTVFAEDVDEGGAMRIVFVYPLLPNEGWIDSAAAVPLEGEALEDYLTMAGGEGMRYKNLPLLPAAFTPVNAEGAREEAQADLSEGPREIPEEKAPEEPFEVPQAPAARILRQPEDQPGRVGGKVTFSVEAENVASYCWQFHNGRVWKDATMKGCDGPSMEVEVSQKRLGYMYRCVLTFADGTVLFSDEARIIR